VTDPKAKDLVILDGALGTELERRGFHSRLPLWSAWAVIEAPDLLRSIHADYVRAGAQVITAATFRTTRWTLSKENRADRAERLTAEAISLARSSLIPHPSSFLRVAASLAPLEDCYRPDLTPDDETLLREHEHTAKSIVAGGADLILVETQNSNREARIATEMALNTELQVWTALMPRSATEMFNGDSLADAALAVYALGADAVLINCCPPSIAEAAFVTIRNAIPSGEIPLGVYPNFGLPDPVRPASKEHPHRAFRDQLSPADFAQWGDKMRGLGATIIGGCCGTTPDHISALASYTPLLQ
jgi:S-methylmethionine-dependent homocysteine/selenocysteine methylase